MINNIQKFHQELLDAGLPVCSVRQGEPLADFTRALSAGEYAQFTQLLAAFIDEPDPATPNLQEQIAALSAQVAALQSAQGLIAQKLVAGKIMTDLEAQSLTTATTAAAAVEQ